MLDQKPELSMDDMFEGKYRDTQIGALLEKYRLPIRTDLLGGYASYTPAQLKKHYELEVSLADRIRCSSKEERGSLYTEVYDRLFQEIPYHPQLQRKTNPEERLAAVRRTAAQLRRYLDKDDIFLEIGPGDCLLSFEMAKYAKKVYAVDVSEEITKNRNIPDNFELILSDGSSIDVPENSVKLAYSNQLLEHLHPDDAKYQLHQIYRALSPGGVYYFVTPHKFNGPTDVSRFFDEEARGLHIKEYSLSGVYDLLGAAGFEKVTLPRRVFGASMEIPLFLSLVLEKRIKNMSQEKRRQKYHSFKRLLDIRVVATKLGGAPV